MSVILLAKAKAFLDVIHSADDDKLQDLLDGAESEAAEYLGLDSLQQMITSEEPTLPASVVTGVMLLLQGVYQASPDEIPKYRAAAEVKLTPNRIGWGI